MGERKKNGREGNMRERNKWKRSVRERKKCGYQSVKRKAKNLETDNCTNNCTLCINHFHLLFVPDKKDHISPSIQMVHNQ